MKPFAISQFKYCPLVWMLHNRALTNRINGIHKRVLRLAYQNENLSLSELIELDNVATIQQRDLQVLVTEIFKVQNNSSPEIMKQVFDFQEPYHIVGPETSQFRRKNMKTAHYVIQSVKIPGTQDMGMVPQNFKNCNLCKNLKD